MNKLKILVSLILGTPQKTPMENILEAQRLLKQDAPEPRINRVVDENKGATAIQRQILFYEQLKPVNQ